MFFLNEGFDLPVFNPALSLIIFGAYSFSKFPSTYLNNNSRVNPFDSIFYIPDFNSTIKTKH